MLKEIVTKAVISKGKLIDNSEIQIEADVNANKVIGCWIINHNYLGFLENNRVYVSGYYDVHIWYAINSSSDTSLFKKTIDYKQEFAMDNNNYNGENNEFKTYCIEYPNCTSLELKDDKFILNIKKGLAIDVIGESKLLVQVSDTYSQEEGLGINPDYISR